MATLFPDLICQWHPTRNSNIDPARVLPGSHRMVWWICEKGHEWRAQVKSRVVGCGCPVCANREIHSNENALASQYPVLAAQWDMDKNGNLTPDSVVPGTRRKVWWICKKGHKWQATVASRVSGSCCPVCSGKQCFRVKMIWQVNFLLLRPSGIRKKTASYHHNRSRQIPTVKSGGGVKRAMIMRLL